MQATSSQSPLYDNDVYAWANHSAQMLKEGRFDELDIAHLVEEIEDMAKSEQRSLHSYFKLLLMHLLKWQFQPQFRSNSWESSIVNARVEIEQLIKDSPSLRPTLDAVNQDAYAGARKVAAVETKLAIQTFPANNPYALAHVLDDSWLPQ
jgi:Domain of unknown function DUF29